jgi:hypothetical protein
MVWYRSRKRATIARSMKNAPVPTSRIERRADPHITKHPASVTILALFSLGALLAVCLPSAKSESRARNGAA